MVQHIVTNEGTQAVLRTLYANKGYSIGQGEREWKKWTEGEEHYWFFAILGTDNVRGTVWLLRDHAVEMGRKVVTEVWTRWDGKYPDIW